MTESLWPSVKFEPVRTPHAILAEQAGLLSQNTNGLLVGRVTRSQEHGNFISNLFIVAPSLNNYAYRVLRLYHPVALYPVTVSPEFSSPNVEAADEKELLAALKEILSSDEIRRVLNGLMAQVAVDDEVPF
jgi:hypothetical protein